MQTLDTSGYLVDHLETLLECVLRSVLDVGGGLVYGVLVGVGTLHRNGGDGGRGNRVHRDIGVGNFGAYRALGCRRVLGVLFLRIRIDTENLKRVVNFMYFGT